MAAVGRGWLRAAGRVLARPFAHWAGPKALGPRGEWLARRDLKRRGLKILARNYRCAAGEADLVALDATTRRTLGRETIAIVEVKTRRDDRYTEPYAAVDAAKQRRLKKIGLAFLADRRAQDYPLRFDIVSVVIPETGKPRIEYLPDAF